MQAIFSLVGMRRLSTSFKWEKKWKGCDRKCVNGEINVEGEPHTS